MRESRATREFIRRTDVVPQIHRYHRQPVIFGENHLQPVLQFILLKFQFRDFEWRALGRRWLGAFLGCRFCWSFCRRRLRANQTCKQQKRGPAKRENNLVVMPHHRVLSNWHNLPFSRRTALAGILKNPTVSLHCFRISAKHFTSFNEGEKHGAVRTTATKPRILSHWFFALCNSHHF